MSTSNQLSTVFHHARQISRLTLAKTSLTTRSRSDLPAPIESEVPAERPEVSLIPPRSRKRLGIAVAIVLIPVVLAAAYVFIFGKKMYVSEARFSIHSGEASHSAGGGISGLLSSAGGGGVLGGLVDGYSVREFLQSRQAMEKLEERVGFVSRIAIPNGDPITRLSPNAPVDKTFATYQSFVQPRFNMMEQILVLRVFAFTPDDAFKMSTALLKLAEEFADQSNKRAREDALRLQEEEYERTDQRARNARVAMTNWRRQNRNVDAVANAQILQTIVGTLEGSLADTRSQLSTMVATNANNPGRKPLEQRIESLQREIVDARKRLTGEDNNGQEIVQMAEYERLKIDQESAEKMKELMLGSLVDARMSVARQQRYVVTVAAPSYPDTPDYPGPWRFLGSGVVAGFVLLVFSSLGSGLMRESLR